MVNFYVKRIRDGKMTLDQVPKKWHDAVAAELEKEQTKEEN